MDQAVGQVEGEFLPAAGAMPEDKYSFAPTNGEFKGVRTFAQQVKHVSAVNYMIGATILEQKPPVKLGGENGPDSITSKADIMKFAKDSFGYLHKALASINDKNQTDLVKNPFGEGTVNSSGNCDCRTDPPLQSLWPDGGVSADEWNHSAREPGPVAAA